MIRSRMPRIEAEQIQLQLSRIESKIELQAERAAFKLEEHGHRLGGLADSDRDIATRLHDAELTNARQQATLDQLREEAGQARTVADSKSNRGVGWVSAAVAGLALILTIAQQLYAR